MQPTITTLKKQDCQIICQYHAKLTSPLIIQDTIYCVAQNGDILKFSQTGQPQIIFTILGQPSSLTYRQPQQYFIVSDFAHQSIFSREDSKNQQIQNLITEYNNRAFLGPNTLKIGPYSKNLYFTDSGPFLESSLENKQGSLFAYLFDTESVVCLSFKNLAYPSGLECDEEEKYLLVSETGQNRILKFCLNQSLSGNYSVFYQFTGRFGPTSICCFEDYFYVALFEFQQLSTFGSIAVLNNLGQMTQKFLIPIGPQITGLYINQQAMVNSCSMIYVSQNNQIHKVTLKNDADSKLGESIVIKNQNN